MDIGWGLMQERSKGDFFPMRLSVKTGSTRVLRKQTRLSGAGEGRDRVT